ncbi:hypothetical protein OG216_09475 [Streptomycetaceae bacterium NBC_01309]
MSVREYLLLDDQGSRSRVFDRHIGIKGELEFTTLDDPELLRDYSRDELEEFDGAIVDFHLNTPTHSRYQPLTVPDPAAGPGPGWAPGSETVEVRTGLGVMLYLRRHAPGMTLFGMTELSAGHAEFFLCAANVWLGAAPLNAGEEPEILRRVLRVGDDGEHLQASHRRMRDAADPFRQLMDSCHGRRMVPSEAYDWLRCFRVCNGPRAHRQLEDEIKRILGTRRRADAEKTVYPLLIRWQTSLEAFIRAWGRDTSDWPDVSGGVKAHTWRERNPVLEYIKSGAYETFFNSPDVRAALAYHRLEDEVKELWSDAEGVDGPALAPGDGGHDRRPRW